MGLVNNVNGQANQPIRVNNLHCPGGDREHKLGQVHENWQTPGQSNGKYRKSSHTLNKVLQGRAPPSPIECSLISRKSFPLKLFLELSSKFKFLALLKLSLKVSVELSLKLSLTL